MHKYLAKGKELVSLHDFFEQIQNPPSIAKRKVKVERKTGAIRNLDMDTTQNSPNMYEYNGQFAPSPIGR